MATTTNYSWTTPDDTALVKDGASAIRALGTAIDTSMNTALGTKKAGMVLLNTTSFSAVASQSVNDVFSATYDNYVIRINITGSSANSAVNMRLRVSGADDSNSVYGTSLRFQDTSSNNVFDLSAVSQTTWRLGNANYTGFTSYGEITIARPFATAPTNMLNNWIANRLTTGGLENYFGASNHANSTSFTSFSLYPTSGTITGSVSVYGVNK